MAFINTNLNFSTRTQSLWRPGPATDLTISSGDTLIWDPDPIVKDFGFSALGFSLDAEFYLDVKFGLLAYASLGTGGHFDADYSISVNVGAPTAVIAGTMMTFDFTRFEVVSSSITTAGFGTPESSSVGKIGAGLDLIIELKTGFRDITFGHWFGEEGPYDFTLLNIDEQISLLKVDPLSPEFTLNLTEGVTLTARLPTGASIKESISLMGGGLVKGEGVSERQFLSLDADLDKLLVRMLEKISFPPVTAVAKFLGEVVFAEHSYDIGDYIPLIGKDKAKFNFTLLDITANAGLNVTEEVSLNINRVGTQTPDVLIKLVSDNGTIGNTADDITSYGRLGEFVAIASPNTTGTGTAKVTATYSINRGEFFHGVGVGINASITIDALSGYLTGAWVPQALRFSFGPLFTTQIPEGGFQINLGNVYEDTFEIAGNVFNSQSATYSVFYAEEALTPTGWNPDLPNAEAILYDYFREAHAQLAAIQANYVNSGFLLRPTLGTEAGSSFNFTSETQKVMFVWAGTFDQTVTLNTINGSVATVDLATSLPSTTRIFSSTSVGSSVSNTITNAGAYDELLIISANPNANAHFIANGKFLDVNASVNVKGTANSDAIFLYKDDASFIDGGGNAANSHDMLLANFAAYYGDVAIRWDLNQSVTEEQDGNSATAGGIVLFSGMAGMTELTIRNIERGVLRTGNGADYLVGWQRSDVFVTGGGNDIVIMPADAASDLAVMDGGDDVYLGGFAPISAGAITATDIVYGGTGIDHAFITPGERGLRYDILFDFNNTQTSLLSLGAFGIGADATFSNINAVYSVMQNFGFAMFAGNPGAVSTPVMSLAPEVSIGLRDGSTNNMLQIKSDVEFVAITDGGIGNDLMIYMGGTRYDGGAGTDTFAANFYFLEPIFGTRGGINLVLGRAGIDGFYGETVIDGFERLLVSATTANDVLRGGAFDDYLAGAAGNDTISGGNDTAADTLVGDAGNDAFQWANNGGDLIYGGTGTDRLDISAGGAEAHGLRYRFTELATNQVMPGSEVFYYAYDSATLLRDAMNYAASPNSTFSVDYSFGNSVYAKTQSIEVVNVLGSTLFDDVLIYRGGTTYVGGENAGDQDTFIANLRDIKNAIEFVIKEDEALDGSDGYLLASRIYVSGIDRGILLTGEGDDHLSGGQWSDYFDAGAGDDTLFGAGGNNVLIGGDGNDVFGWAASGNDTISGGTYRDLLGDDALLMAGGDANSSLRMFQSNGTEITYLGPLTATAGYFALNYALENHLQASRFIYDAGTYILDYENISKVEFVGSDAFNEVALFQYGTSYWGGEQSGDGDLFMGDFRYYGNPGRDFGDMVFDARTSGIYDAGTDLRIGGFERFALHLGAGDHVVRGGNLGDMVYGFGGYTTFLSGLGDDLFNNYAGAGGLFEHTGGHDTVIGSIGVDTLVYTASSAVTITFYDIYSVQFGPTLSRVGGLQSMADFQAAFDLPVYSIRTAYGSNSITTGGLDEIFATGSAENDVLMGGQGQNFLDGGFGDDVLMARYGNTLMMGGEGNDTYVFDDLFLSAIILNETDANINTNLFFTGATFAELSFYADGQDLVITQSPQFVVQSTVRIVDYFATAPNGYNFAIQTTDAYIYIDLSYLGGYTGLANAARSVGYGSAGDDDFGAGNHVGRAYHMGGGDDFARAGAGGDWFFGGVGQDAVSYVDSTSGVTVQLFLQTGSGGFAEGDIFSSIEHVAGSAFDDLLIGSVVANTLASDLGNDSVRGGDGDDALFAGEGNDLVYGGNDDDMAQGDAGNDTIYGDSGSDALFGGQGDDLIYGDDHDDLIETGTGNDTVFGGLGNDILSYSGGGFTDEEYLNYVGAGYDLIDGGDGLDWVNFAGHNSTIKLDLSAGGIVYTQDAVGEIAIATATNIENMRGSAFGDILIGNAQDNIIDGGLGFDDMTGHAGNDTFISGGRYSVVDYSRETGGSGIDLVFQTYAPGFGAHILGTDSHGDTDRLFNIFAIKGTNFADNIQGNDNDNEIDGGGGNDFLYGLNGNDWLWGNDGNDTLVGFYGADTLHGGEGANVLHGDDGDDVMFAEEAALFNTFYGGAGFDVVEYSALGIEIKFGSDVYINAAYVGSLQGIEHVIGSEGNDTIQLGVYDYQNPSTEYLRVFSYQGGYDRVSGTDNILDGTVSFGQFDAAVAVSFVTGAALTYDSDVLGVGISRGIMEFTEILAAIGSAYGDHMTGAAMVPVGTAFNVSELHGGAGNDTLIGLGGSTVLDGGEGDDYIETFVPVFDEGGNNPFFMYVVAGGAGFDTLRITGRTSWAIDLAESYTNLDISSIEGMIGSVGNDTLYGNAGENRFEGGAGDDAFDGRGGDDMMIYTSGVDAFTGGAGNDTLDLSQFGAALKVNLALASGTVTSNNTASVLGGVQQTLVNIAALDVEHVIGGAFNDRIYGNELGNMLDGGQGRDSLYGAGGNDLIVYDGGLDFWYGGAGIDTGSFAGFDFAVDVDLDRANNDAFHRSGAAVVSGAVTNIVTMSTVENILGTAHADQIRGDSAANTLWGNGGNDILDGRGGHDTLIGGDARDTIYGGTGNDSIIAGVTTADLADVLDAGTGDDTVFGGAGNDSLLGQSGNDALLGELGQDTIIGGSGNDTVYGGRDGDSLLGGLDRDVIYGGDGDDTVSGDEANDTLYGDAGDDLLTGGSGLALIYGGDGHDTMSGSTGSDAFYGGAGFDMVSYAAATSAVLINLFDNNLSAYAIGGAAGDSINEFEGVIGTTRADTIYGNSAANRLLGGDGNDQLLGNSGTDVLDGGSGNDSLDGGFDQDLLRGGAGVDTLLGAQGEDMIYGGQDGDSILGGNGQDEIYGDEGNDIAFGEEGDDTIYGGEGNDSLYGGDGIDALHGDGGNDRLIGGVMGDAFYGGAGIDTADYSASSSAVTVNLTNTALNLGDAVGDIYDSIEIVLGSAQSDNLTGDYLDNILDGGLGGDTMLGGFGNDTYVMNSSLDRVFETTTSSSIDDAGGIDLILSAINLNIDTNAGLRFVENVTLTGTSSANVTGNALNNVLTGNGGNNVLNGRGGADTMIGGGGNDSYSVDVVGDLVFETTTQTSTTDAGGNDTVTASITFSLESYAGVSFVENLTLTGTDALTGTGNTLANVLTGNAGNNILNGRTGDDTMIGGAGSDTYYVGAAGDMVFETTTTASAVDATGDDKIISTVSYNLDAYQGVRFVERLQLSGAANLSATGNALANTLTGNNGANQMNGGLGNDTMSGSVGADTFVFNTALGAGNIDRITDFSAVDDTIHLDDAIFTLLASGTLSGLGFVSNLTGAATTVDHRIIYESDTGRLLFDADGSNAGAAVQFATLNTGLSLTNADFFVI